VYEADIQDLQAAVDLAMVNLHRANGALAYMLGKQQTAEAEEQEAKAAAKKDKK
jgi:hypothetical protein